ncbi:zinc finger protein 281b isoform X1 [Scyliorhinus canicula]|uniref:zinc finger protein 281b isoform X1 n=2 Tax=Scyliorhinus canicula TaxID=7830 RepID=UPI0018F55E34|nr:zinc finger protein 281b isoform X1 [Scyliorhinus canicula]
MAKECAVDLALNNFRFSIMSIVHDKLANEFLRNGGMEPNFSSSMIMFSHLPPITNFSSLAAHSVTPAVPQDLILKKDPDAPAEKYPSEYMQPTSDVKEKKFSAHDGFVFFKNKLLEEEEMGRGQSMLTHSLNHTSVSQVRYEKDYLTIPKPGNVKRAKKQNSQSQDTKPKRKRSETSKSSTGGDGTGLLHGPKVHICEHCCASFRSSYHLRRHVLIHTGERPFQCSQCNMCFIQKYLLQRHEKIHSGEKPFCCDQCNMRFIQKYHMERHKRTHSGEKPYQCHTCQQYFSRTDRLLKHRRTCGEVLGKSENGMEPGPSNQMGNGCFTSTQGARKKAKSKAASQETKEKAARKKIKTTISELPSSLTTCKDKLSVYNMHEYAVEMPMLPSSMKLGSEEDLQTRAPKLVIKKVNRKSPQRTGLNCTTPLVIPATELMRQKLMANKQGTLELNNSTSMDNIVLLQNTGNKTEQASNCNYDDAMQFFKKKRYLQAASSNNDYAVSIGQMASQQSVIQAAVASVMDNEASLTLLDSSPMNVDVKVCHEKSGIPDEVLQSLLDQYSHKHEGQHDVPFDMTEQHIPMHSSGENPEIHENAVCPEPHASRGDKTGMLQEYSKYLQQALERTSQSDGFSLSPGMQFCPTSLPASIPSHNLFPDKQAYNTPALECGFSPSITSVLPTTSPKSHFGLLVGGSQPGIHFPGTEAAHQRLTPSQELVGQLEQQKNLEAGLNHQVYQIENFAQAFGSQFKTGGRVPMTFSSGTGEEAGHRIRTTVSEFSGYTNLLSDANEPISTGAKTPTSQSYR